MVAHDNITKCNKSFIVNAKVETVFYYIAIVFSGKYLSADRQASARFTTVQVRKYTALRQQALNVAASKTQFSRSNATHSLNH